jgi:hypothetical protein
MKAYEIYFYPDASTVKNELMISTMYIDEDRKVRLFTWTDTLEKAKLLTDSEAMRIILNDLYSYFSRTIKDADKNGHEWMGYVTPNLRFKELANI